MNVARKTANLLRPVRGSRQDSTSRDFDVELAAMCNDPIAASDVVIAETEVGSLALHADDQVMTPIISASGSWEDDEAAWLRSVIDVGQTVIDCGANVGYFTLLMSRAVGPGGSVVAVEPERENLRLLRHNLWTNGADNVRVIAAAANYERGSLALRHNAYNKGDHQTHRQSGADDVLVPCVTLDEVLPDARVDIIKIDTQGSDHLVVAGMKNILDRNPAAKLLVEFSLDFIADRGWSADDVLDDYRALGRPLAILETAGSETPASNEDIISTARVLRPDHWINIVIGPRSAPAFS